MSETIEFQELKAYLDADQHARDFIDIEEPLRSLIARVEAAEGALEHSKSATQHWCEIALEGSADDALRTALEQAKAREAELLGALEPFANQSQHYDGIKGDSVRTAIQVQLGWLRNAVTALGGDDA